MNEKKCSPDYSRAAEMACRCLIRLGVDSLPIRPADVISRCRNTLLMDFGQAAEALDIPEDEFERRYGAADAFTFRYALADGQVSYLVCYRAGGNAARLNFTLAHELGHIVLRHQSGRPWEEYEADCFAANLLCPAPILGQLRRRRTDLYAEELAELCFITLSAAETIAAQASCPLSKSVEEAILAQFAGNIPLNPTKKPSPGWHRIA